jgi:hypothetical protein
VVVEQALGDVEQLGPGDPEALDGGQQGAEVVVGRLVGADVLGGDDGLEAAAEAPVAGGEAVAVDVGHDQQPVPGGQGGQGVGRVGKAGQSGIDAPSRPAQASSTGRPSVSPVRRKAVASTSGEGAVGRSRSTAASWPA